MFDRLRTAVPWLGVSLVLLLAAGSTWASQQQESAAGERQWPPQPTNLQVLPADTDPRELIGIMRGFATGLGVRCNYCHVGEDPQDLSTHDFASDAKNHKAVARVMMRMVNEVNGNFLASLDSGDSHSHGARLEVRCSTCHHGQARPLRIEDVLADANGKGGAVMALAEYDRLRGRYYGSWTYDFSEGVLLGVAEGMAREGDTEGALALIARNLELYPESFASYLARGQVEELAGNPEGAEGAYRKCVELNPRARPCQAHLERLSGEQD